ncbi:uncharacterized protein [Antedon mediterranea]|uniref:uncharacterized protein n=1 Tax=Antedon mediterranea TaxID=105859 RepID=UPI003AF84738
MDRDCPAYLTVGTDVSAKYRGAFCEAKVKTTAKHVKCKINFKGLSAAIVSDEFVNGTLKIGAGVSARHPEQGVYLDGVITKLTDASMYTVVFDDGDEKTLRRSSLCLQGERHFNESETLDHLPLTDPENFGTPVVRDAKKRKKRKPIEIDEEQMHSGVSPSSRKGTANVATRDRGSADVGKVVIVDINEKRKNSWFPALVIHPKRTKEVLKNKEHFILKSFKDNKIYNIAKNNTKAFTTKDHLYKGDNNTLKSAVSKAVSYIETGNLPNNWDSSVITEEDFVFESDDEVDSDEESDEDFDVETDAWLASLYKFMEERGTPINKPPVLGYQDLNLFKLFKLVQDLGGFRKVTDQQKWREISFKMGIPVINSSSHHNIKASYMKYLHAFEEYNRKLGPGLPGPLTRTTRRRSSFERPTLSPIRPRTTRTIDEDGESDTEREPPMLKRRVTITELEEEEEKPVKRQNKKEEKQKAKDIKKEELDKEDDTEGKINVKSKASDSSKKGKEKQITETEDLSQIHETDTDYQLGEKIKVLYGRGRTQKVYEAKIIEIDVEAHWQKMYRVHYVGWNIRHDEWIGNNRIVGSEDRVKMRKKQKQDKDKEKEKKFKEKEKKEKEEKERLQREEKERTQKEHEKLLKDKKEKEKQEKEKERLEKERIKKEKEKMEKEKKEKHEKEIRENERLEKEREKQEKEVKKKDKEKLELEKKEKEDEQLRLKDSEIADSLESKKREKKDEKGKGKGKVTRSREELETSNTDKVEKEDQPEKSEVERPKTPGKRGRPSLKSSTTPVARSNSVTRKVPSPVSSTKLTRTRRSDRNSLSESPFAAGLDVKPRTRRTSIHSDTKLKQEYDSESESSISVKDEGEKTEEVKDADQQQEEEPVKESEDIKVQIEENEVEKEQVNKNYEESKDEMEEPEKDTVEIKQENIANEVPVVEEEQSEQPHIDVPVEIATPKGKEKKKEKKEGKIKKKKEGKGKKEKKDHNVEKSLENITTVVLESTSGYQENLESVQDMQEEKTPSCKIEIDEKPKKESKSEGKKSRKRRRSKSISERRSKETENVDFKDKDESKEYKKMSVPRSKEEEGAAALMDIYNPSTAFQEKCKSLTPPTTPENSPPNPSSPADQSVNMEVHHDEPSNRSDSDGLIDVAGVTDVQPIGNRSPHCDASVSSNTSADSLNGTSQEKRSGSSKKRRRTISGDTPSKRKKRSHKHSSHDEKKKRHIKEPIRHSSSDTDDTSNNDNKTRAEKVVPKTPTDHNGRPIIRSGRTPKYNFRVDLTNIHDPEERISIIQHQLNEMRKIYMSLKSEVASIDRRRKKLRRKERENKAAAATAVATPNGSSDRKSSDRNSNDGL